MMLRDGMPRVEALPRRHHMSEDASARAALLRNEIALAERHVLMQRVSGFPPALRRQVVKHSLNGIGDAQIASDLRISLSDVRAIMEAFHEFADEQAL
jgi:DNA-directed RNA polymerase specialized sigma24 family protein